MALERIVWAAFRLILPDEGENASNVLGDGFAASAMFGAVFTSAWKRR